MRNLDLRAAEIGQDIAAVENEKQVKELQIQLNKCLGVLQESGVYALFIYLSAKRKKSKKDEWDPCQKIMYHLAKAVKNITDKTSNDGQHRQRDDNDLNVLEWVQGNNLHHLLLIRDFFQRTLTYARYAAEAKEVEFKRKGNIVAKNSGDNSDI